MKLKDKIDIPKYNICEELLSAISHGVGSLLSIAALVLCVVFSVMHHNIYAVVSSVIYGSCSIILYTMSTLYHSLKVNNAKRVFRILDHDSIFLLIAGMLYTIGLIFYGIGKKKKYMHSIFHFFVLSASILFFFSIFLYVI